MLQQKLKKKSLLNVLITFITKKGKKELAKKIGTNWIDLLTIPILTFEKNNPTAFIEKHLELLQHEAQLHVDDWSWSC